MNENSSQTIKELSEDKEIQNLSELENYPTIRVEVHFFTICSVQPVKTQIAEFWNQDLLIVVKVFEEGESA